MLVHPNHVEMDGVDIRDSLMKGDVQAKITTLKTMIAMQLNGESMQPHLMSVMKFCSQENDHELKKLFLYFLEVVDKADAEGNVLQEMILLCSGLYNDLQHPNEYIRGITLRFLCKLKERDLFQPLVSAVKANLTYRVAYVRRNAVLAIHTIYENCPDLIPDAPELIEKFIMDADDVSAQRNAFNMLVQCDKNRAVRFLHAYREVNDIAEAGDVFQLAVVQFIRTRIDLNPYEKAEYIPLIMAVMQSKSAAVSYQCALTLLRLSNTTTAIRYAAQALVSLLTTHSDSNVRFIVLERLREMSAEGNVAVLQDQLVEMLRGLTSGNTELRRQILAFSEKLVSHKNIEAYVQVLKKELVKSQQETNEGDLQAQQDYRHDIVKAIHTAVMSHLHVAPAVMPVILDYICESGNSAVGVVNFVREVMQRMPEMRTSLVERLLSMLPMVQSPSVMQSVLWLLGTHSTSAAEVKASVDQIRECLEPFPLTSGPVLSANRGEDGATLEPETIVTTTIQEDNTYATTITSAAVAGVSTNQMSGLRTQVLSGNYFLAASIASALAKLAVKAFSLGAEFHHKTELQTTILDMLHELIKYGTNAAAIARNVPGSTILDRDSHERIRLCMTLVQNPTNSFILSMVEDSAAAYGNLHKATSKSSPSHASAKAPLSLASLTSRKGKPSSSSSRSAVADLAAASTEGNLSRVDQPILFSQLFQSAEAGAGTELSAAADDILAAVTNDEVESKEGGVSSFMRRLHRVKQLSGMNDPVYVEACVTVHQFDVQIDWNLVNLTGDTLSNLAIEVAAVGPMVCDRPQLLTIPPHKRATLKTSIKVNSTKTRSIYASCLFDVIKSDSSSGGGGRGFGGRPVRQCVVLNEVQDDVMDYLSPSTVTESEFRTPLAHLRLREPRHGGHRHL